ncbi:ATPase, AAA-type, core [Artemisia annua]|uniref:ATPase, AAA-type, core n=1 Tax=Artemisia annua TaxID=35608 RepID=A0A2U1N403_ARTAN|nr:ATPase, AAA-type, core [Artemisia annua]
MHYQHFDLDQPSENITTHYDFDAKYSGEVVSGADEFSGKFSGEFSMLNTLLDSEPTHEEVLGDNGVEDEFQTMDDVYSKLVDSKKSTKMKKSKSLKVGFKEDYSDDDDVAAGLFDKYLHRLIGYFNTYMISIEVHEYQGCWNERNEAYKAIEHYLSTIARPVDRAKHLKASVVKINCKYNVVLSTMDNDYGDVIDEFKGINIRRRYFKLTCHEKHREFIIKDYINHVMEEGKAIAKNTRHRKLYAQGGEEYYNATGSMWCGVHFEHPSNFVSYTCNGRGKKKDIIKDLKWFRKSKGFYRKTSSKSLIVLEDIDCSLDLTGKRILKDIIAKKDKKKKRSEMTVSELLNSVGDGLWAACGSGKIIVFATNHIEKLDQFTKRWCTLRCSSIVL